MQKVLKKKNRKHCCNVLPDWQTAEVQLSSPVRRSWTRRRKLSLSWLSFVSSGSFPHTPNPILSWTLTLVLKGFLNRSHPGPCPLTESAEDIYWLDYSFYIMSSFSRINRLIIMENPHRILKCADILNGCCFLPWWGVYFAWTCPAHSCGTAGTDGAGCVMEGWCSDWEVGGCTVEAQSAFALGVCARLSLLAFWTGKAASAAEGRHSSHKLNFKKERKKMMKTAAVKKKKVGINLLCTLNV